MYWARASLPPSSFLRTLTPLCTLKPECLQPISLLIKLSPIFPSSLSILKTLARKTRPPRLSESDGGQVSSRGLKSTPGITYGLCKKSIGNYCMNVWMKLLRIISEAMYAQNHTRSSIGKIGFMQTSMFYYFNLKKQLDKGLVIDYWTKA